MVICAMNHSEIGITSQLSYRLGAHIAFTRPLKTSRNMRHGRVISFAVTPVIIIVSVVIAVNVVDIIVIIIIMYI